MDFSKHRLAAKKHIINMLFMLFIMLMMVAPVFANTRNWNFVGTYEGNVVNGGANGIYHNMSAGTLTNSGRIWVTATRPQPTTPQAWYFEVWKENGVFDFKVCTSNPVIPSTTIAQSVYFSKNCGNIDAGSYFLVIFRYGSDGRAVSGEGTLSTP